MDSRCVSSDNDDDDDVCHSFEGLQLLEESQLSDELTDCSDINRRNVKKIRQGKCIKIKNLKKFPTSSKILSISVASMNRLREERNKLLLDKSTGILAKKLLIFERLLLQKRTASTAR